MSRDVFNAYGDLHDGPKTAGGVACSVLDAWEPVDEKTSLTAVPVPVYDDAERERFDAYMRGQELLSRLNGLSLVNQWTEFAKRHGIDTNEYMRVVRLVEDTLNKLDPDGALQEQLVTGVIERAEAQLAS